MKKVTPYSDGGSNPGYAPHGHDMTYHFYYKEHFRYVQVFILHEGEVKFTTRVSKLHGWKLFGLVSVLGSMLLTIFSMPGALGALFGGGLLFFLSACEGMSRSDCASSIALSRYVKEITCEMKWVNRLGDTVRPKRLDVDFDRRIWPDKKEDRVAIGCSELVAAAATKGKVDDD